MIGLSRNIAALLVASLLVASCTGNPVQQPDGTYVGQWDVVAYVADDGSLVPPTGTSRPTLVVDERTVRAATGCNALSGGHSNDDDSYWSVAGLAQTLMACEPELMMQERAIGEALSGATRWKSDARTMTLEVGDRVLMRLAAIPTALEGSSWNIGGINNQREPYPGITSVVRGTNPSLSFNVDGSVSGFTGCNEFTATYATKDGSLEIGSVSMTRKSCAEDRLMEQELTMIAALWKITGYTMAGHSLRLTDEQGGTQVSAYRATAETAPSSASGPVEVSVTLPVGDPHNLALGKPVVAPGSYQSSRSAFVDGDYSRGWNSGGFPRQWIEVDLTAPSVVKTIRLLTGQSPAGETTHIVSGWGPGEANAHVLHVFDGPTKDRQWLNHTPDTPWQNVQFVRIETIVSPSWVAWFEFEAIGWVN